MPGDLTNKLPLFVEVHSVQKGFIVGEDLVGLGDDPDLMATFSVWLTFSTVWDGLWFVPLSYHLRLLAGEGIGRVSF